MGVRGEYRIVVLELGMVARRESSSLSGLCVPPPEGDGGGYSDGYLTVERDDRLWARIGSWSLI